MQRPEDCLCPVASVWELKVAMHCDSNESPNSRTATGTEDRHKNREIEKHNTHEKSAKQIKIVDKATCTIDFVH